MAHHYLLTYTVDDVVNYGSRLLCGIDYKANLYFRQERDGLSRNPLSLNLSKALRRRLTAARLVLTHIALQLQKRIVGEHPRCANKWERCTYY